jgi:putative transposase
MLEHLRYLAKQKENFAFETTLASRSFVPWIVELKKKVIFSISLSYSWIALIWLFTVSVKTTEKGGTKGYDRVKKIKGRKQHILVDTEGLLLANPVTEANVGDRVSLQRIVEIIKGHDKKPKKIWADTGYNGQPTQRVVEQAGYQLEMVKRPRKWFWIPAHVVDVNAYLQERRIDTSPGFKLLPQRWTVERTFAWLGKYRRLSKDYEYLYRTSEVFSLITMTRTTMKRLGKLI